MKGKTAKLNGTNVPYGDILQIQMKFVSDEILYEVTYRSYEPSYHETAVLLPRKEGYELEKKVRRAMNR